jgi:seryl-tRNA synthetase
MQDRVEKLEKQQQEMRRSIDNLANEQNETSKAIGRLEQAFEAKNKSDDEIIITLRNLDDSLTELKVDIAKAPLLNLETIQKEVHPVYEILRRNSEEITTVKINLQKEIADVTTKEQTKREKSEWKLQKQAGILVVACGVFIAIIFNDIRDSIEKNTKLREDTHSKQDAKYQHKLIGDRISRVQNKVSILENKLDSKK